MLAITSNHNSIDSTQSSVQLHLPQLRNRHSKLGSHNLDLTTRFSTLSGCAILSSSRCHRMIIQVNNIAPHD